MSSIRLRLFAFFFALIAVLSGHSSAADPDRPVVRVVYFTPTDRKAEADRQARLDRVMTEVQRFYREGMKRNGHGPMTFELDRDAKGALRIYEVAAKGPMRDYGRNSSGKVRGEVKAALAKQGLDIDRETIILFQQLLEWNGEKAIEVGSYVGSGGPRSGTAWVYDDAKLDPELLSSKKPGGFYNGPCSIGKFNTHYVGGTAHELGHAFGLPHEAERDADRPREGASLMGGGNHTYGQEKRGEGKGSFLSPASAVPLSVHPLFTGKRVPATPMTCRIADLKATHEGGKLRLVGQFKDGPPAQHIVARNDPSAVAGDYDSVGWTCPVGSDGRFNLEIGELKPGKYDLRMAVYGTGGDHKSFTFAYTVDKDRKPDTKPFAEDILLRDANAALKARDAAKLTQLADKAKMDFPAGSDQVRKVEHLRKLLKPAELIPLEKVAKDAKEVSVADLKLEAETVGWGRPLRNQTLAEAESVLLECGGNFFESGLFAHAPARHALKLDGSWTTFSTCFGIKDGSPGSVVFVVKADGKELYRSDKVLPGQLNEKTLPIAGVRSLELLVEDAGDGGNSDWGLWLGPKLRR